MNRSASWNAMNWMASLVFIQLLTRAIHFGLNLIVVRKLSPDHYGLSAMQIPLVTMAVTRLLKEALHRVSLRGSEKPNGNLKNHTNRSSSHPEKNNEKVPNMHGEESVSFLSYGQERDGISFGTKTKINSRKTCETDISSSDTIKSMNEYRKGEFLRNEIVNDEHGGLSEVEVRLEDTQLSLVWLSVPCGIFLSGAVALLFVAFSSEIVTHPWMYTGTLCWLVSAWMELATEPMVLFVEHHLLVSVTLIVECLALAIYCISSVYMLSTFHFDSLVLLQAYGQLILSTVTFLGYAFYAIWWKPQVIEEIWPRSFAISRDSLAAMKGFLMQSFGKYLTAEGEHLLLFLTQTPEQQGLYEFVHSLGSLVARVLFSSMERTGFAMFSRLRARSDECLAMWSLLLRLSLSVSVLYLATAPCYVYVLVELFYGERWAASNAPGLLILYGVLLLFLGINGLVEALRDAVARDFGPRLQRLAPLLALGACLQLVVGWALSLWLHSVSGLIIASALHTLLRTFLNFTFFGDALLPLSAGFPPIPLCSFALAVFLSGSFARYVWGDSLELLAFAAVQILFALFWLFLTQRPLLQKIFLLLSRRVSPSFDPSNVHGKTD